MTILRHIEDPSGDNTGFVERVQHENNAGAGGLAASNYNDLKDKPLINGVILQGSLSLDDLYIQEKGDYAKANEVPTKISELENDKNYITEYTETDPTIPQYIKDIKEEDIVSWNAKSEFSGNYDDLNNKPEIPSIAGLATEEYVNNAISKIPSTDLTGYATLDDVDDAITEIVGSAPETLDTLAELAEGLVANKAVVEVLNDAIVDKVNRTELNEYATQEYVNEATEQLGTIHGGKQILTFTNKGPSRPTGSYYAMTSTSNEWLFPFVKNELQPAMEKYGAKNIILILSSEISSDAAESLGIYLWDERSQSYQQMAKYYDNKGLGKSYEEVYPRLHALAITETSAYLNKVVCPPYPQYFNLDKDYETPYMPKYDGSPTTKKYVDDSIHQLSEVVNNTVKVFEGDEDEYNALTQEERDAFLIAIVNPFIEEDEIDLDVIEEILSDVTSTETELDLTDEETEAVVDNIIGGE